MEAIERDLLWRDFFYTEITTGLRRGEICGLKWSDLDTEHGTLKIERSIGVESAKAECLRLAKQKPRKAIVEKRSPFSIPQRPYQKMY